MTHRFVPLLLAFTALAGCGGSDVPDGGSSGANEPAVVDSATPSDARVESWADDWCSQTKPGMTRDEMLSVMGPPTEEHPREGGTQEQMVWRGAQWHFTAFFDLDHTVRQLDTNTVNLTEAEKTSLTCEETRRAE